MEQLEFSLPPVFQPAQPVPMAPPQSISVAPKPVSATSIVPKEEKMEVDNESSDDEDDLDLNR